MPASMASIREKSETTHGKGVPSRWPEPRIKRRGRKIANGLHLDPGLHRLEARNPDASLLVALLGFNAIIVGQLFIFAVGFAALAVMGFVVTDDDVLLGSQLAAHAANHLAGSLGERTRLPIGEVRLRDLSGGDPLSLLEGVVVGGDDLGLSELVMQLGRYKVALAAVVARVVRQQYAQPVTDSDAGHDDQKGVGNVSHNRLNENRVSSLDGASRSQGSFA